MVLTITLNAQLDQIKVYYDELASESQKIGFIQKEQNLTSNYDALNQIILLRHGEPALNKKGWRTRVEAKEFIQAYDTVGIFPPSFIPVSIASDEIGVIHTSTLNRSISTAKLVFNRSEIQSSNPLFREFERKIFWFPNMRLPIKFWTTGSRILWLIGLNKRNIESFKEAKHRAKDAASFLAADAKTNKKTLLVSHGFLNRFLVKYLTEDGWTLVYDGGKGYLSQKVLVKYDD